MADFPQNILMNDGTWVNIREKQAKYRYGNTSKVRMELRCGDDSTFELKKVIVDYLKTPQYIELTRAQLDNTTDTSQIIEFPDYVCQEIVNEIVRLIMENSSDPRLQTFIPITNTITNPVLQQSQQGMVQA